MKKPRKNTPTIKYLRNKADKLYQEIGRQVFGSKGCLICHGEYSCLHHFIPKSCSTHLRYDFQNGIPICCKCHLRIHSSPDPTISVKIKDIMGQDWFNRLSAIRGKQIKVSKSYYLDIIDTLEKLRDK
jgi:hypothetical protein